MERFSHGQRDELYDETDGHCAECGRRLEPSWHSDHIVAKSRGGPTTLENGQALCPPCNLKHGAKPKKYRDKFKPRVFQEELVSAAILNIEAGRRVTVGFATPGWGKELAHLYLANTGYREGYWDFTAVFVPRVTLAEQAEITWMHRADDGELKGSFLLFDERKRMGKIRHVLPRSPLLPPGEGIGYTSTYTALVTTSRPFLRWAEENKGRFLLVADEAQFCSDGDMHSDGTRAGMLIQEMSSRAAHTLLLTGTDKRVDGQRLVLAEYSDPDEKGTQFLTRDAEGSYRRGVTHGYLRPFEMKLTDCNVTRKRGDKRTTYKLSSNGEKLWEVLRKPEVWQPICDDVVQSIREKQQIYPGYRGLLLCMEREDARRALKYLNSKYPGLKIELALSDDSNAKNVLKRFKPHPERPVETAARADLLITVRMAFIGYDCKEIIVVGNLTNYRWPGHLLQGFGRGLRVDTHRPVEEQMCRIHGPDDPDMKQFLDWLADERDEGIRQRDDPKGPGTGPGPGPIDDYVEEAHAASSRAVGPHGEVSADELLRLEELKRRHGIVDDVTKLAVLIRDFGQQAFPLPDLPASDASAPIPADSVPQTEQEQITEVKSRTSKRIRQFVVARYGVQPSHPDYQVMITKVTSDINRAARCYSGDVRTLEQARARREAIEAKWSDLQTEWDELP